MGFIDQMDFLRSKYHLTLGELIKALEGSDKSALAKFDDGSNTGELDTYRGYYTDCAISPGSIPQTVGDLLERCKETLDQELYGWKGGSFVMHKDVPLWKAYAGDCGPAIIWFTNDQDFVLITKDVE